MNTLQPWQRTLYFLGEAVMVGGLVWGLYRAFILRSCPSSVFNDITLIVIGLGVSTLPLHPFGNRSYFTPALRKLPVAALLWWLFALAGIGCSLYLRFQAPVPTGFWWFFAIVPAALYFWFAIPSRVTDRPLPPGRAPEPPVKKAKQTDQPDGGEEAGPDA